VVGSTPDERTISFRQTQRLRFDFPALFFVFAF